MPSSEESADEVHHISFKRQPIRHQHIRDAQNAEDWPEGQLHEVVVDPDEITVEGTPEGIRWLYDFFHHLSRAWRHEGEQFDADVAEKMANTIWTAVDGDLPDQQRNREAMTDGGEELASGTDRHDPYVCSGCGEPIPEGTPHDVVGLATVCLDCSDRNSDTDTERGDAGD